MHDSTNLRCESASATRCLNRNSTMQRHHISTYQRSCSIDEGTVTHMSFSDHERSLLNPTWETPQQPHRPPTSWHSVTYAPQQPQSILTSMSLQNRAIPTSTVFSTPRPIDSSYPSMQTRVLRHPCLSEVITVQQPVRPQQRLRPVYQPVEPQVVYKQLSPPPVRQIQYVSRPEANLGNIETVYWPSDHGTHHMPSEIVTTPLSGRHQPPAEVVARKLNIKKERLGCFSRCGFLQNHVDTNPSAKNPSQGPCCDLISHYSTSPIVHRTVFPCPPPIVPKTSCHHSIISHQQPHVRTLRHPRPVVLSPDLCQGDRVDKQPANCPRHSLNSYTSSKEMNRFTLNVHVVKPSSESGEAQNFSSRNDQTKWVEETSTKHDHDTSRVHQIMNTTNSAMATTNKVGSYSSYSRDHSSLCSPLQSGSIHRRTVNSLEEPSSSVSLEDWPLAPVGLDIIVEEIDDLKPLARKSVECVVVSPQQVAAPQTFILDTEGLNSIRDADFDEYPVAEGFYSAMKSPVRNSAHPSGRRCSSCHMECTTCACVPNPTIVCRDQGVVIPSLSRSESPQEAKQGSFQNYSISEANPATDRTIHGGASHQYSYSGEGSYYSATVEYYSDSPANAESRPVEQDRPQLATPKSPNNLSMMGANPKNPRKSFSTSMAEMKLVGDWKQNGRVDIADLETMKASTSVLDSSFSDHQAGNHLDSNDSNDEDSMSDEIPRISASRPLSDQEEDACTLKSVQDELRQCQRAVIGHGDVNHNAMPDDATYHVDSATRTIDGATHRTTGVNVLGNAKPVPVGVAHNETSLPSDCRVGSLPYESRKNHGLRNHSAVSEQDGSTLQNNGSVPHRSYLSAVAKRADSWEHIEPDAVPDIQHDERKLMAKPETTPTIEVHGHDVLTEELVAAERFITDLNALSCTTNTFDFLANDGCALKPTYNDIETNSSINIASIYTMDPSDRVHIASIDDIMSVKSQDAMLEINSDSSSDHEHIFSRIGTDEKLAPSRISHVTTTNRTEDGRTVTTTTFISNNNTHNDDDEGSITSSLNEYMQRTATFLRTLHTRTKDHGKKDADDESNAAMQFLEEIAAEQEGKVNWLRSDDTSDASSCSDQHLSIANSDQEVTDGKGFWSTYSYTTSSVESETRSDVNTEDST